jgi:DNA repair exonuclease SbcCD ATPase subunit
MEPLYICLENFLTHRKSEIDCSGFDSVLIFAEDKDNPEISNGVGKTTIFYAIEYALFGTVPSDTIDEVIRDGEDSCRVEFSFKLDEKIYKVERIRKKNSKKTYVNLFEFVGDKWENKSHKTASETHEYIQKLIKISASAFRNSVLFSQSDLSGLVSGDSNERRAVLKSALILDIYKKYESITKDKITELNKKIAVSEQVLKNLGDPDKDILEFQHTLNTVNDKLNQNKILSEQLKKKIEDKNNNLIDLKSTLDSGSLIIYNNLSNLKKNKKDLIIKINGVNQNIKSYEQDLKTCQDKIDLKKNVLDQHINKLQETSLLIQGNEEDLISLINKMAERESNGNVYLRTLDQKIKELKKPLPNGGICPCCKQEVSEEYISNLLNKTKEDLDKLISDFDAGKIKLEKIKIKKVEYEAQLSEYRSLINKVKNIEKNIEFSKKDIESLVSNENTIKSVLNKLNSEFSFISLDLPQIESQIEDLEQQVNSLDLVSKNEKISKVESEVLDINRRIKLNTEEIGQNSKLVGAYTEKLSTRKSDSEIKDIEYKRYIELKNCCNTYKVVAKGFGSGGIPTLIIYTILDELQIEANNFLSKLRPGLEVQFVIDNDGEDVLDIIFSVNGKERTYKLLSGGQKFLFAVSLKLALSMVIQKKIGVKIKFLQLDEVDQALDQNAVNAYADVINELKKDFKIFVITHNNSLKDKFRHAILVKGSPNGSTSAIINL